MYVLQLCHDYQAPFLSVANQYAGLFNDTPYKVVTVYLKGQEDEEVVRQSQSDEVIFLNYSSRDIRGLKRKQIKDIKQLHDKFNFKFAIAQRYKATYICASVPGLNTIGISHIPGMFKSLGRKIFARLHAKQLNLLGVSKAVRDAMRTELPYYPNERIGYLYNSLDYERIQAQQFERAAARDSLGLDKESYIFSNVGRLHPDKDQKTLISAFTIAAPSMPNARLVIAGKGELAAQLQEQIEQLGMTDKINLLGMVPEAYRYLSAFDCFILSSIREGLPVAMLEAFAAKLPCIASRCSGNEEAIEGVGNTFEIGDINHLSDLLIEQYQMSDTEKGGVINNITESVEKNFAANAVVDSFWQLPMVTRLKG
jgi:glycosyltransferase involved in cell wall biosynthesis